MDPHQWFRRRASARGRVAGHSIMPKGYDHYRAQYVQSYGSTANSSTEDHVDLTLRLGLPAYDDDKLEQTADSENVRLHQRQHQHQHPQVTIAAVLPYGIYPITNAFLQNPNYTQLLRHVRFNQYAMGNGGGTNHYNLLHHPAYTAWSSNNNQLGVGGQYFSAVPVAVPASHDGGYCRNYNTIPHLSADSALHSLACRKVATELQEMGSSSSSESHKKYVVSSTLPQCNKISQPETEKRCSQCNNDDTPMWRKGPLGPKSLCNACGIKYRKDMEKKKAEDLSIMPGGQYN
ncbi:uncharacterized protein LOC131148932 [Malania oleifera]|uniref:uncharacterized protein LOC131148932 n=1 Tax=Malania oleifera TaxID=397392 RepID=UPI0025AE37C2|nr:uncharacterized protein LOC131148932 [Malania oleifera]XP_057954877.1 uncharacterized protein LOC131148932 [Malania oleifera]